MKINYFFCNLLVVLLFFLNNYLFAQVNGFYSNETTCGTPTNQLTPKNLELLNKRTAELPEPMRHFKNYSFKIGNSSTFYVYDFDKEKYVQISATLRGAELNINVWVEDTEWNNNHVNATVVQTFLQNLLHTTPTGSIAPNQGILTIIHESFGMPPNFDGDGITDFLITDIKDGWSEGGGFIGGYFNPIDQYINGTSVGGAIVSGSNERDLLYIDSYPGIYHAGTYRYENVLGTLSHEYQHLVQFHYDKDEHSFVNEGLSELSSFLCGYDLRNPSGYLFDTGKDLTRWTNTLPEALDHYSKVALWTYYLFEKFSVNLIREMAQSSQSGISGINDAFQKQGISTNFDTILLNFFSAITLNNTPMNDLYGFNLTQLQDLHAVPANILNSFPSGFSKNQEAYSLQLLSLENGDSLNLQINAPASFKFYLNKTREDSTEPLIPVSGFSIDDPLFGQIWQKEELMVINSSPNAANFSVTAQAKQKFHIGDISYNQGEPNINILSQGNINANQFVAPFDSCVLKSVSFYNSSSSGMIRINVYSTNISGSINPPKVTKNFANILQSGWVEIDLQDLQIIRHKGKTFDIGIEYVVDGAMGYASSPKDLGRSFLKQPGFSFLPLSNFEVTSGNKLTGVWMMNMTYLAPLHNKPASSLPESFVLRSLSPNPFPIPGNPTVIIEFIIQQPGNMNAAIYNVLGQKVITLFDSWEARAGQILFLYWDGKNRNSLEVASGTYFLNIKFGSTVINKKIIFIR